jgi:MFS family permease
MAPITINQPRSRPPLQTGRLLTIVLTGQFMAILDVSIVNVATPTIRTDLEASGAGLQLVVAGYTIAYAMLLITGARLGDLLGHRSAFLGGLAIFTSASLVCGAAGTTGVLITFRFVQGAAAALMVPQVMSVIQRHFHGEARARALSLYAAVMAGAVVAGQILGGALVGADIAGTGWRPIFLVNVPIGLILLAAGARTLPGGVVPKSRGLDLPGLVALSVAVVLFVVPLVLGHDEGWPLWGWLMIAASGVALAAFAGLQRRARSPLIPGRVMTAPGMIPALVTIFLSMAVYGGFLFSLTLHLQGGLSDGPLRSGLSFLPGSAGFALASLNWRRVPEHLHRAMVPLGLAMFALGCAGLGLSVSGGVGLEVAVGVMGLGLGASFSPLLALALTYVAVEDAADASGLLVTTYQLGQVVGVATFGTVFLSLVPPSGHAMAVTGGALAITALVAACCALPLLRHHRTPGSPVRRPSGPAPDSGGVPPGDAA